MSGSIDDGSFSLTERESEWSPLSISHDECMREVVRYMGTILERIAAAGGHFQCRESSLHAEADTRGERARACWGTERAARAGRRP